MRGDINFRGSDSSYLSVYFLFCALNNTVYSILLLYRVYKKKGEFKALNIHEYSLCLRVEKTFGPWDLRRIVIVFSRHYYLN